MGNIQGDCVFFLFSRIIFNNDGSRANEVNDCTSGALVILELEINSEQISISLQYAVYVI